MNRLSLAAAGAALAILAGCTNYYRVTDPSTGSVYYTTNVKKLRSGAVEVEDPGKGTVTIQNSEIVEINKEEYKANTPKR